MTQQIAEDSIQERNKRRVSLTVRFNGAQHQILTDSAWQQRRSASAIVREATMEFLRVTVGSIVPAQLDYLDE